MMAASISAHHSRQLEENPQHNIRSSWSVRHAAGEPFAVVRVRNLQTAVQGPHDAWGREGKLQPLLVSAELSFNSPFGTAVADDKVTGGDTVHYGSLSKTILATVDSINHLAQTGRAQVQRDHAALMALKDQPTLMSLLQAIWLGLTGSTVDGAHANQDIMSSVLVDVSRLRFMSLTVCLPKASLLGEAVSLTASSVFETDSNGQSTVPMFGISLQLHKLRVPTLIGVNDNERLAKQFVVTDVEIDRCICGTDVYTTLESLIVKTMEQTSFETLEALGAHLADKIMGDFRPRLGQLYSGPHGWQIRISMEKPTAVPFADCPVVEVRAGAGVPNHK